MTFEQASELMRSFGERRRLQGDEFLESSRTQGAYFYQSGYAHAGIRLWGSEEDWMISVFSAARVNMRPTFELYRFISRWRTTSGTGAPYVVEDGESAAVMCERSYQSSQLTNDVTAWRLVTATIDLVAMTALSIERALQNADGVAFTATGATGLATLLPWWEISDTFVTSRLSVRE